MNTRLDFPVALADEIALNHLPCSWDAVLVGGMKVIILRNYAVPEGYNVSSVDVLIKLDGYPISQLDMVYVYPPLNLISGKQIGALTTESIDGRTWQRWSRHYDWRPSVDDLGTHIQRVQLWLEKEAS